MKRTIAVVALIAALLAVGAFVVYRILVPSIHPEDYGMRVVDAELNGRSGTLRMKLVFPHGVSNNRPLLVLLHGRGSSPQGMLSDELFAALREAGLNAPIVVLPESPEEGSYWHDREAGDFGSMVTEAVIPFAVDESKADADRVAIGGMSMGGFGALDLARQDPTAFCAVGAHSPALWRDASDTAEGAFDDAEDFESHDVMQAAEEEPGMFGDTPVWIDVGADDPFADADEEFAGSLEGDVTFKMPSGGHDESYWWSHMDEYISFYATACAD